jgi:hypothetical protein
MKFPKRDRTLVFGLYVNAVVMVAILVTLLTRGGGSVLPAAFGAPTQGQPIAGGGSIFLMPGQLSVNSWGCYIMDIDAQTLCCYQFYPGEKQLRLVAARNFHWDRKLGNYNTAPPWPDVKKLGEIELQGIRANEDKTPEASPEAPKDQ